MICMIYKCLEVPRMRSSLLESYIELYVNRCADFERDRAKMGC